MSCVVIVVVVVVAVVVVVVWKEIHVLGIAVVVDILEVVRLVFVGGEFFQVFLANSQIFHETSHFGIDFQRDANGRAAVVSGWW